MLAGDADDCLAASARDRVIENSRNVDRDSDLIRPPFAVHSAFTGRDLSLHAGQVAGIWQPESVDQTRVAAKRVI